MRSLRDRQAVQGDWEADQQLTCATPYQRTANTAVVPTSQLPNCHKLPNCHNCVNMAGHIFEEHIAKGAPERRADGKPTPQNKQSAPTRYMSPYLRGGPSEAVRAQRLGNRPNLLPVTQGLKRPANFDACQLLEENRNINHIAVTESNTSANALKTTAWL